MKYWCTNTEYSADISGYICTIMNKPCPYVKPYYTEECAEIIRNMEIKKVVKINNEVHKIWRKG